MSYIITFLKQFVDNFSVFWLIFVHILIVQFPDDENRVALNGVLWTHYIFWKGWKCLQAAHRL